MVVFIQKNGDILIMHNHSFSSLERKHTFDMIYIFNSISGKVIREEKGKEVDGKEWDNFLKNCGTLQKDPIEINLED